MIELKDPEIEKVLVLSTGHIRETDGGELRGASSGDDSSGLIVTTGKFFWLVYCGDLAFDHEIKCVSDELVECLRVGNRLGCAFVKFDRDGPEHDELPTFDW